MPKYTLESGGKKYTFSSDSPLSDSDLQAAAAQAFGEAPRGEGDKYQAPQTPESIQKGIFQAGQPEKLDVVQRAGNIALPMLATAPTIAAGGEALPAAPMIGRALTSGAIGGAESASKGQNPLWGFGLNTLTGMATEGVLKGLPNLMRVPGVGSVAGAASKGPALEEATSKAGQALAQNQKLGRHILIPEISRTQRFTLDEAVHEVNKLRGSSHKIAKAQLEKELNAFDTTKSQVGQWSPFGRKTPPPGPYAGDAFKMTAPKGPVTGLDDFAERFVDTLDSTALRALAEAIARKDIGSKKTVMPIGAAAGEAATMGAFGGAHSIYNTIKGLAR